MSDLENQVINILRKENERLRKEQRDFNFKLLQLLIDLEVDVISPLEQVSAELTEELRTYYTKVSDVLFKYKPEENDEGSVISFHIEAYLLRENHTAEKIRVPFLSELQDETELNKFKEKLRKLEDTKYGMFTIYLCCGKSSYRLYSVHIDNIETAIEDFCKKLEVAVRLIHTDLKKEHL